MPRKRKPPEDTQDGEKAKKPRINRGKQNEPTVSPTSSSHGDNSPQAIQSAVFSGKEEFRGQPPVWAKDRVDLCNTLNWFRSYQGGSYQTNKKCYGFLVDGHGGPRDYIDDEIVITRVGGGCVVNNGTIIQNKDHEEDTSAVVSLHASKDSGLAVGLIVGNKNDTIWRKAPHRYNVMGWFRVVDVWFEKTDNGKFGARVRFQKLDLEMPSWWARKGSEDPLPLSQRMLVESQSETCHTCGESSKLTYEQGWMCLQRKCEASGKLKNGTRPTNLMYDTTFLSSREPPDDNIQPHFSLIPDLLNDMVDPDAHTRRDAWRGVVCPQCKKCISRKHWNGWICSDPLDVMDGNTAHQAICQWQMIMEMPAISIQSVLENGATKRAPRIDMDALIQPSIHTTNAYKVATYEIDDVGQIFHLSAKKSTLARPNGPDELFEHLQEVDLGLCRFPLNVKGVTGQLISHFAANFGMPYKFVVPVHSKGFDEAPAEIMIALGRLDWATNQVVGNEVLPPNELLTVGYFEQMSMGYHDDGEDSLGPTIASLSLGAKATMRFRLKDQYFRGKGRFSKVPVADDAVLPGCDNFEKREELKEQHDMGQLNDVEYAKQRMELADAVKKRESRALITLDLLHGDMVVMHGSLLQKYYEHSVTSEGKLRFALTARHVLDDKVEEEDRAKGQYTPSLDHIYDGK